MKPLIEGSLTPELINEDVAVRAFITSYLGDKKIFEWKVIIAKLIALDLDSEEKKRLDFYYRFHKTPDAQKGLEANLTLKYVSFRDSLLYRLAHPLVLRNDSLPSDTVTPKP